MIRLLVKLVGFGFLEVIVGNGLVSSSCFLVCSVFKWVRCFGWVVMCLVRELG